MISQESQLLIDRAKERISLRALDRSNPLLSDLPPWFTEYRAHQIEAINAILAAYDGGIPVVVLDAPTGSGKTLIAETVRRLLRLSALYICTTKTLQDQFLHDYDYAKILKGRSNYRTERHPRDSHLSTADCTKSRDDQSCRWCNSVATCPYERAKHAALKSTIAVLNTSYLLTESNGPGRFSNRPFVIADEADCLEKELMSYVSVEISPRRMAKYDWSPPKKVTVPASWGEWIAETLPKIQVLRSRLPARSISVQDVRESKYLDNLESKLRAINAGLEDAYWVYTGRDSFVSFKPARVDSLGQTFLWRHSKQWLLMSATVISTGEMLDSLGYTGAYETVSCPSTFPVKNRLINVVPAWNGARKVQEEERPKLAAGLATIIARHPTERVLVHSVSYDLSKFIRDTCETVCPSREVVGYTNPNDREVSLKRFLRSKGGILIAPSFERGVDLPHDSCRIQIIAKTPFPYLGDRQISTRLYSKGGQAWYTVQAIRSVVQMTGRAVRSEDDWAVTYILDSQFRDKLWKDGRFLFPKWWSEALVWTR